MCQLSHPSLLPVVSSNQSTSQRMRLHERPLQLLSAVQHGAAQHTVQGSAHTDCDSHIERGHLNVSAGPAWSCRQAVFATHTRPSSLLVQAQHTSDIGLCLFASSQANNLGLLSCASLSLTLLLLL